MTHIPTLVDQHLACGPVEGGCLVGWDWHSAHLGPRAGRYLRCRQETAGLGVRS